MKCAHGRRWGRVKRMNADGWGETGGSTDGYLGIVLLSAYYAVLYQLQKRS